MIEPYKLLKPFDLPEPEPVKWLVTELWANKAVGFIAGEPKSFKSWLALDMAISVASGTPCLGEFSVPEAGKTR